MVLTLPTCFDIYYLHSVIMAALWNRGGHYILVLWFLLSFSLAYFQLSQIGCLPYFHTWCGLIANLECRSEMCCTQLTENTGRKKLPKIHHLGTIALLGCTFATKACINNRKKKPVKQQYLLHMSPQYGELQPISGWDRFTSLGHPSKFQQVSRVGFATAVTSLNRMSSVLVQYIYIFGGVAF